MKKIFLIIIAIALSTTIFSQNITDTVYTLKAASVVKSTAKKVDIGKLNIPLQYIPISVATVSENEIETRGIVNLQDATKFLPGTRMRTTYGAYQQFEVRGFDYTPIMIDGVRDERTSITNSTPLPDLSSVESIELLRGPASVLYGHSTVGGILNIKRKSPTEQTIVNALLSYGSWNNKRAMMDFGGKLFGPFNYRAVVNWSNNEGYRYTNDKRFSGYFATSAKFKDNQELDIRFGFNRDWYGTEIGLPRFMANDIYNSDGNKYLSKGDMLPNLDKRWRYNNESDFMINNASNALIKYNNKISDFLQIENRLAYNYDNIDYFSTEQIPYLESNSTIYNHYYLLKNGDKKYICLDTVVLNSPLRFAYTLNVINEQIEASGKFQLGNIINNYVIGYNFVAMFRNRYRGYNLGKDVVGPGLNSHVTTNNPHSMGYMETSFSSAIVNRTFTHSIYLQNLVELSRKVKIMLSGRYDYFSFWNAKANTENGKRKYIDRETYQKTYNSAFTYRVGAVYLPHNSISIYGSVANIFSPYRDLYNERTIYINSKGERFYPKEGEEIFKPQTGYQTEIGIRYSLNSLIQATGSAYYIRRNNEKKRLKQGVIEDGIEKTVVGQVGSSESKGFELEVILTPIKNAALSLGYGFTDATIRDLKKNEYMETDPQKGMQLAGVPKNTFFVAGNYQIIKGLFKNLGVNITVSYTDNVYRTIDKSVTYPAYWLTDLGASYKLNNGIRFGINVNNVFNKDYYNQSLGTQMVPSTPRNYLLSISYHFN